MNPADLLLKKKQKALKEIRPILYVGSIQAPSPFSEANQ
jgi:hypothetical protein